MRILIAIYSPPEYYPPLLNAVNELSEIADEILIVTRNISVKSWNFQPNVRVIRIGKERTMEETFSMGLFNKAFQFISFIRTLRAAHKRAKFKVWQANDSIPLFAFFLMKLTGVKSPDVFWYHNHDVSELSMYGKYSVGWWSSVFEQKAMRHVHLFTIPAKDRLSHFNVSVLSLKTIIVPNFPALRYFIKPDKYPVLSEGILKMFYQGSLSAHHGFEELIPCLGMLIDKIKLTLTIIGPIEKQYKEHLLALADKYGKMEFFKLLDPVPYAELKSITRQHHVGLAIHKPIGRIYSTGGTASNKIYEYAANGLPVILHDNPHYKQYLGKFEWAFFTDCTCDSLKSEIAKITDDYQKISNQARRDFENELNFESVFSPVKDFLKSR